MSENSGCAGNLGSMGQPVAFLHTSSPRAGIIRFELNRTITGMGHERYQAGSEITGDRAVDVLAKRLLDTGELKTVHIYGSVITAELVDATATDIGESALEKAIVDLHTYYVPGVEIPSDEEVSALSSS